MLGAIWPSIVSVQLFKAPVWALSGTDWQYLADGFTEMKYLVAALYSNYSTAIVDDTGIEQIDSYTAPPKSDKLIIRLEQTHGLA